MNHFVLIGAGQVDEKYWLKAHGDKEIEIKAIVGLEEHASLPDQIKNSGIMYYQTHSRQETLEILGEYNGVNIGLVLSGKERIELVREILVRNWGGVVFIEKPYGEDEQGLGELVDLVKLENKTKLHLASKYATSRADILYKSLPTDKLPESISLSLIEGHEYFNYIKQRIDKVGYHPYLEVGPELDLGFHLVDILVSWAINRGEFELEIDNVWDLASIDNKFEKSYAFGANLVLRINESVIPVSIAVGKGQVESNRKVVFRYGKVSYEQEYTTGVAIDPVYLIEKNQKKELARHKENYNYYSLELGEGFGEQSHAEQLSKIWVNRLCLEMKRKRLEQMI